MPGRAGPIPHPPEAPTFPGLESYEYTPSSKLSSEQKPKAYARKCRTAKREGRADVSVNGHGRHASPGPGNGQANRKIRSSGFCMSATRNTMISNKGIKKVARGKREVEADAFRLQLSPLSLRVAGDVEADAAHARAQAVRALLTGRSRRAAAQQVGGCKEKQSESQC